MSMEDHGVPHGKWHHKETRRRMEAAVAGMEEKEGTDEYSKAVYKERGPLRGQSRG